MNLTGEYVERGETNRAGPDSLRVNPPRVTQRIGDAATKSGLFWVNGAIPFGRTELYMFGGASSREGNSSGFFRPSSDRQCSAVACDCTAACTTRSTSR